MDRRHVPRRARQGSRRSASCRCRRRGAAREVEHIARLGLKGACFRPSATRGLALYDDSAEAVLGTHRRNGLFAAVHGSFGALMPSFATGRYDNLFFSHMICHPFEQMAAMLDIVAGGVLERHPTLRVAFLESGLGWLEYWLDRLDGHFESMHQHVPWMRRRPSELFREQCFISIEIGRGAPPTAAQGDGRRRLRLLGRRLPPLRLHLSRRRHRARGAPGADRAHAGRRRALAHGAAIFWG
jgi:hypothetical protein